MIRLLFFVFLTVLAEKACAQKILELEKRNGFKDLILGMHVDSVKVTKFKNDFKEREEFDAKLFTVENEAYKNIGEVAVKGIEIKTYKDLVYEITVVTEKDPRLMKALESLFGQAEYDMKKETYFWKAPSLVLKFKSLSRTELQLTYSSFKVHDLMKQDKKQKVQDIADDF